MGIADPPPEEVFAALLLQRLRLRHDQQVPECPRSIPPLGIARNRRSKRIARHDRRHHPPPLAGTGADER
jgi:hypothetical protein